MATMENITESTMENTMDMKHKKNKKHEELVRFYNVLMILCGVGVVLGIVGMFFLFVNGQQEENTYEEIRENQEAVAVDPEAELQENNFVENEEIEQIEQTERELILEKYGVAVPEKKLDFTALQEECEDIYAWIYVPGTTIDYPVLQHPTDDTYYLNHNMDGSSGRPGAIYTESINNKDFSDPHTVLYGHNMRAGTMFATLHNFEDRDFFEDNRFFFIYTPQKTYVYEVYAAYTYSNTHLIKSFDLSEKEIFQIYLDGVFEIKDMNSNMRTDLGVNAESHIVTLSTCVTGEPNNRYLVQGVLLNED